MPTYYTTTSSTSYPYYAGTYWTTSTTTDCSGYTSWTTYRKEEMEYLKRWIKNWDKSIKQPEITDEEILGLIEGDD